MTVNPLKFWVLSGCYRERGGTCHQEVTISANPREIKLRTLGPNALRGMQLTEERVAELWQYFEENAPTNPEYGWKYRTLFTAALCKPVIAICFTPANEHLTSSQLLYAMKGEDASKIYGFTIPHVEDSRFISDVPQQFNISITTEDLNGRQETYLNLLNRLKSQVDTLDKISQKDKKALRYILLKFTQDPLSQAIALTLKREDDTIKTYIWTKVTPNSR